MKLKQLVLENTQPTIDDIPGLKPWLNHNNIPTSNVQVHEDKSITLLGDLEGFVYGSDVSQHFPTVIRRVTGSVYMFIEGNNFQEAPKLNIHKWIKQVDGEFGVSTYSPFPILSFLMVKIARSLDIEYHPGFDDPNSDGDVDADEELAALMNTLYHRDYDIMEAQQELIDAGYSKFARM